MTPENSYQNMSHLVLYIEKWSNISRLLPYIAKWLNMTNIAILALSLLLLTLAISINNIHSDSESEAFVEQTHWLISTTYKSLPNSRLWFVKPQFGGGVIITNNVGQVRNKISAKHYNIYIVSQSVLLALVISACVAMLLLMVNGNYLRLVAGSAVVILIICQLKIAFLFSTDTNITIPIDWQIIVLAILVSAYWLLNNKLLKNNRIGDTLIAYASQSGSAMSLAKRFKKALSHSTDVRCFSTLSPSCLTQYSEVLFIASTYGDGQPPEKAQRFIRKLTAYGSYAKPIQFSILALGDRHYPHFCKFGHQLNQLLAGKGAKPMFNLVEVDKLDSLTIGSWWHKITTLRQWKTNDIRQKTIPLTIVANTCLNPSQKHRHSHLLQLTNHQLDYQVGDLLEVVPQLTAKACREILSQLSFSEDEKVIVGEKTMLLAQAMTTLEWQGETADSAQQLVDKLKPLSPRVYSIVSAPHQEHLNIFVRRHHRTDGTPGIASNYLCDLTKGQVIQTNIRVHSNFHLPSIDAPLILIGAGTGIAPLIAFLRHRAAQNSNQKHWLFFGEQYKNCDFYFQDEIKQLKQQGVITQLSLAWSRDDNASYIGEHIKQQHALLRHWINELGAYIYVCGNQTGFGDSVGTVLNNLLGKEKYVLMKQNGRLRTDLY